VTDREKLIELIQHEVVPYFAERIADHLIANGVTIQQWIPVAERLPDKELWEHQKLYDDDLEVLAMIKGAKKATTLYYDEEGEFYAPDGIGATFYIVTHWMPLPEAPKEV
jgi:hypothetical protein